MSIAVIHHLSTETRRLRNSIQEINRILKIGGKNNLCMGVEQPRFENEKSQDVNVKWMLQKKYSEKN